MTVGYTPKNINKVPDQDAYPPLMTAVAAPRVRVLFVTSEMSDFVQTGGLGEVSAALPRALRPLCDIRVLIPGYRQVLEKHRDITLVGRLPRRAGVPPCSLGKKVTADGLVIYVLLCPELYDRPGTPYGDEHGHDWPDNDIRFARLGLAAADMASGLGDAGWAPHHLHLNDWQSSLAAGYLAWRGQKVSSLLTIHNLAYQGLFAPSRMATLGIPTDAFRMDGVEFHGKVSFLKAGLFYASKLSTVSATYAEEITREEHGCGLHGLLAQRASEGRLLGILNGIDESWNPRLDPHGLESGAARFQAASWKTRKGDHIRGAFGLPLSMGPLFAIVSRLVYQKGIDLAVDAAETIVAKGGQLVVTGVGEPRFETAMRELARKYPTQISARIGFDAGEAREMFAGSDFLLMPSRFEPCGLSQMYAQRYGSLPIAHRTGGLADTIRDGHTGFLFGEFSRRGFHDALDRAFEVFGSTKQLAKMRRTAMANDFGWDQSAREYIQLYDRLPA